MFSLLIIDDEEKHRKLLARLLTMEGYKVSEAGTAQQGLKLLAQQHTDIIICDVKLPDAFGVDLVAELKNKYPTTEIILLTAYGNIPDGVKAIKNGAFDYIVKGDDNDRIIPLLSRATEKASLQQRVASLEARLQKKYNFDSIIGESAEIKQAIALAGKVAPTDVAVLLTGETGTGKEVFAQSIHYNSKRSSEPFVALNCSALSKEIMESELFGHKAGAFTGAMKDKKGLIEEAKGGTLFLDEIGEMPQELQPKLLRFLENGTYYRVGETVERKADVRIITASNREFKEEIEAGHFRSDLYYRIAVFTILLPALRDRNKDIPMLAQYYLRIFAEKTNGHLKAISKEAIKALQQYAWPGNIRELKNVIERAVILADGDSLEINNLPYELQHCGDTESATSIYDLALIEKQHIRKVLQHTSGNKTEAARLMNIGLATLYRKIEEYSLK
ncbi:sigma-54-dependent transcriptional regulator [Taibaiella soli]|uniref:Sigma-54-dependent Fis family transcriptional regulator n=1 Tax=Taibaiella soli TaxID=1649169 RepID=A0A2W2B0U3_9BACT|nr:sigma-54 dependent transcriptional regulator [Taibaiella soli]PZF73854.1 sigma-54-dependent Fis family transcriptional regulator [Taibaiella soli]